MKYAEDFRSIARTALRGNWPTAVLTGFLASLMGACIASAGGGSGNSGNDQNTSAAVMQDFRQTELWLDLRVVIFIGAALFVVWLLVIFVIGGAGKLGYATFNLKLIDRRKVSVSDLFSQFHRLGTGFLMSFLVNLYITLWSLLLVIPGLIKSYSYAMTPYILAEHPELSVNDAITRSREIMDGNKWRLFCLGFSFIGWSLLCALPVILALIPLTGLAVRTHSLAVFLWLIPVSLLSYVGMLFLRPYQEAAWAAFYRDVSGTEVSG